jgi:O-antigen/teichoic acid export membrane protein
VTEQVEPPIGAGVDAGSGGAGGEEFDLSGVGRNWIWSTAPTLVSTAVNIFLLAFSIRKLGATQYGAVVTIGAATGLLTLFSGALRYGVTRVGAAADDVRDQGAAASADTSAREAVAASHSIFVVGAGVLVLAAAGLGWLVPVDLHFHGTLALETYLAAIMFVSAAAMSVAVSAYAGVLGSRERFATLAKIALGSIALQAILTVLLAGPYRIIGLALTSLLSAVARAVVYYVLGRAQMPWLHLRPRLPRRPVVAAVLRYAGGLVVLSATATISSSSDAFVIGALRGSAAVTVFRIGITAPSSVVGLLYSSFGVVFPRLVRSGTGLAQEEAVGWLGRVVGWITGSVFAGLCLLGAGLVHLLLGRPSVQATEVLWICAAALAVDVAYHGAVQVIFARGEQGNLAKYSWIELTFNLAATYVLVRLYGPVGSAWTLAATIVVTDLVGFPIIMRGRWGTPPGRFVLTHGVLQSVVAAALTLGLGVVPMLVVKGLVPDIAVVAGIEAVVLTSGYVLLGPADRARLVALVSDRR